MSWLQILVLGAAVGFGEIFPLSGSGISVPVRQLLGLPLDGSGDRLYSALLRIAVWLAVCLVLRRELWSCLRAFSSPPRSSLNSRNFSPIAVKMNCSNSFLRSVPHPGQPLWSARLEQRRYS